MVIAYDRKVVTMRVHLRYSSTTLLQPWRSSFGYQRSTMKTLGVRSLPHLQFQKSNSVHLNAKPLHLPRQTLRTIHRSLTTCSSLRGNLDVSPKPAGTFHFLAFPCLQMFHQHLLSSTSPVRLCRDCTKQWQRLGNKDAL